MNSPAYLVSKISQRVNYNIGKVLKEAGLGNNTCKFLIKLCYSHGSFWIKNVK
jgi:hypothetical protein